MSDKEINKAEEQQFIISTLRYKLKNLRKFILLNYSNEDKLSLFKIEDGLFFNEEEKTQNKLLILITLKKEIEKGLEKIRKRQIELRESVEELGKVNFTNRIMMKRYLSKVEDFTESYLALMVEKGYKMFFLLQKEQDNAEVLLEKIQKRVEGRLFLLEKRFKKRIDMGLKEASQEYVEKTFQELRTTVDKQTKNFKNIEKQITERKKNLEEQLYLIKNDTVKSKESLKISIENTIEKAQNELRSNITSIYRDFKEHIKESLLKLQSNYTNLSKDFSKFTTHLNEIEKISANELSSFQKEVGDKIEEGRDIYAKEEEKLTEELKSLQEKKDKVIEELSKIENIILQDNENTSKDSKDNS